MSEPAPKDGSSTTPSADADVSEAHAFDRAVFVARLGDALGTASLPSQLSAEVDETVARTRNVFAAAACSFAVVEGDGATLRFIAADGAGSDAIVGVSIPIGRGIAGWAAMSGDAISVADVAKDSRFARDVAEASSYVPSAVIAVPVVDRHGDTMGVLEVLDAGHAASRNSEPVARDSAHDLSVLGLVAAQLASTLRLSAVFDALGNGLLRMLVDPDDIGAFDGALRELGSTPLIVDGHGGEGGQEADSLLAAAQAFRTLADRGPAAAALAQRILTEVADYTRVRR